MKKIALILAAVVMVACGGKKEAKQLSISIPQIPSMIEAPAERVAFMAEHYWDNMPFGDTTYINKEVTLQAFSDYANMLTRSGMPVEMAVGSVDNMMNRARVDSAMFAYFARMAEDHFFTPNVPYRNDDIYVGVLQNILTWDGADELHKLRPRTQLALANQNRVGQAANPLTITLADDSQLPLYDVKADYTLLYFANPDCPICKQLTEDLQASPTVERLVGSGKMRVVTVYAEDNLDLWRSHAAEALPAEWTNGYAIDFNDEQLYDLRAIPSMYLLDRDKKVLLKDAMEAGQIDWYFGEIVQTVRGN